MFTVKKKLSKRCFSSKQTLGIGEFCSWSVFFAFYQSNLAIFNFCQQQSKESYIYWWVLSIQNSNFLLVNDASFAIWNFSTASMLPWVATAEQIKQQRRHLFIIFFFKELMAIGYLSFARRLRLLKGPYQSNCLIDQNKFIWTIIHFMEKGFDTLSLNNRHKSTQPHAVFPS